MHDLAERRTPDLSGACLGAGNTRGVAVRQTMLWQLTGE
jgi:hypothetical protein